MRITKDKLKKVFSIIGKSIGALFLSYIALVLLFMISMGVMAYFGGNFDSFWKMLMSV